MTIHSEALLQDLAVNVINQAIKDLKKRDPVKALDALSFLAGADFEIWSTTAGAEHLNPFRMLSIGGAKRARA